MPFDRSQLRVETDPAHLVPAWSRGPTPEPVIRWFPRIRFSLRTLLIAVVLFSIPLGWFGWQVRIVRHRKVVLQRVVESGGCYARDLFEALLWDEPAVAVSLLRTGNADDRPSEVRQWLGDQAVYDIILPKSATEDLIADAKSFPEASVFRFAR